MIRLPNIPPSELRPDQRAVAAPGMSEVTAMRNGSLQGAYLIIAARAGAGLRTDVRVR